MRALGEREGGRGGSVPQDESPRGGAVRKLLPEGGKAPWDLHTLPVGQQHHNDRPPSHHFPYQAGLTGDWAPWDTKCDSS